jgi:hypothetical protein
MKEDHINYVLRELDGYDKLRDEASGAEVTWKYCHSIGPTKLFVPGLILRQDLAIQYSHSCFLKDASANRDCKVGGHTGVGEGLEPSLEWPDSRPRASITVSNRL